MYLYINRKKLKITLKWMNIKLYTLGIEKEGGKGTYLGLPECFSASKTEMLAYIYDKLKDMLSGYFARLLSQSGKEVLLKTVAMVMPIYAMSCFKLTKSSSENLTQAMAAFWWDSLEHKRKIHWLKWEKCVFQNNKVGWPLKTFRPSIKPFLLNKLGDYLISLIPCLQGSTKVDIS